MCNTTTMKFAAAAITDSVRAMAVNFFLPKYSPHRYDASVRSVPRASASTMAVSVMSGSTLGKRMKKMQ